MLIWPLSPSSAAFHFKPSFACIQVVGMWEFALFAWRLWNLSPLSEPEPEPKPPSRFPPTDSCFQLWGTNPCAHFNFFLFCSQKRHLPCPESPNDTKNNQGAQRHESCCTHRPWLSCQPSWSLQLCFRGLACCYQGPTGKCHPELGCCSAPALKSSFSPTSKLKQYKPHAS